MSYSDKDIKKYLDIIHNFTKSIEKETDRTISCWNCQETEFDLVSGFVFCINCGSQNGRYFESLDKRDQDRLIFRKKSVYQRKYHYEKKVNQISKRLKLTEDEKYDLFKKLMEIDNKVMEKLNKQFSRKRTINIMFLMKKMLEEIGSDKHKLVELNIGNQTLVNYENWWGCYKSLK